MNLSKVPQGPPDAVFGVVDSFRQDKRDNKVNLVVGAYRDGQGKPWVLPSVREAESRILKGLESKEYLPITGDAEFLRLSVDLVYGDSVADQSLVAACQSVGGTSSLRIAAEFLFQFHEGEKTVHVTEPTWGNQRGVFKKAGFTVGSPLPWYNADTRSFDFDAVVKALEALPEASLVLLHACCHNPTGCDPNKEQWERLEDVCAAKKHVVALDAAYLGFGPSADLVDDAFAIRLFAKRNRVPLVVCQSYSKNFSLYGERVGTVSIPSPSAASCKAIMSQLALVVRPMYSNPPRHGAAIVRHVLGDAALRKQWEGELATMAKRIAGMRQEVAAELARLSTPGDWSHVTSQIGMFSFTGLSRAQVERMRDHSAVYMLPNGRISVAGLNPGNVNAFCAALHDAVTTKASL